MERRILLSIATVSLLLPFAATAAATSTKTAAHRNKTHVGYALSFVHAGMISAVSVKTGQKVHRGDVLVTEDSAEATARLHEAQAALVYQQLKLTELNTTGTSSMSTADALKLQNALSGLDDMRRTALSTIADAYIKADDAVHNRADQFFQNAKTSSPFLIFVNVDGGAQLSMSPQRVATENTLAAWKTSIDSLSTSSDIPAALSTSVDYLAQIKNFLNSLSAVVNNVSSDTNITQYNLHLWKGDLYTGRLNINNAAKDLITVRSKLRDAQLQVDVQSTQASTGMASKIAKQTAVVQKAQAAVEIAQVHLQQTTIKAPSDGTITKILISPSSVVSVGTPVVYFKPIVHNSSTPNP